MEKINSLVPLQQWQHSARFETPDIGWVLICTALVLLMTPGIAFFYGGLVHRKNALSVLIQVLLTTCIVTIVWVTVGYSLALAPSALGGFIGNLDFALLENIASEPPFAGASRPATTGLLYMIFMAAFAIIAPAIIVGGCAERMKLSAFAFFAPLWTLLVYCPVAKWIWGNEPAETGFFALQNAGALDFAGGTVVHVNAGVAALVAALMVGKRREPDRKNAAPHNIPFCVLGAALLWFGWFGFNGGSAGAANPQAAIAFVNTQLAAASGGLAWFAMAWTLQNRPSAVALASGVISGLVAITPACGYVSPGFSLLIGAGGAVFSYTAVNGVKRLLSYDDSLDAFGVHGVAGIWGAIGTGLFASLAVDPAGRDGVLAGNPNQIWIQLRAVLYVVVWSGSMTWLILFVIDRCIGLRASEEDLAIGLDISEQAQFAYSEMHDEPPA